MQLENLIESMRNIAASHAGIGKKILFATDQGAILLDGTGSENVIFQEDIPADLEVSVSVEDLQAIIDRKLNPVSAFFMGKVKVRKGEISDAAILGKLFT